VPENLKSGEETWRLQWIKLLIIFSNQADAFLGGSCKQSYQEHTVQTFQKLEIPVQYCNLVNCSTSVSPKSTQEITRNCHCFINTPLCSWHWIPPFQETELRKPPCRTKGIFWFPVMHSKL